MKTCRVVLCLFAGLLLSTFSARANIYATDIRFNGVLAPTNSGTNVNISYRLNQAATSVKIVIMEGTTNIVTLTGGTAMGSNSVNWPGTNSLGQHLTNGVFSVAITAATAGFTTWQQISVDSNPGMPAFYPLGIAVNNNSNSPYYGRVVMSSAAAAGGNISAPSVPAAAQMVGLYKMNADGSQAEEGWYGNAGYLDDDGGDLETPGQMPGTSPLNVDPMKVRIGEDDRIYWVDNSEYGAIIATDMQATTNGIVISDNSNHTYTQNPDFGMSILQIGIQMFDVLETTTTNASIYLCDVDGPAAANNWGIWMFHLTNGASDITDPYGVQVVQPGNDMSFGSTGGCMVDTNLDIFCAQGLPGEDAALRAMVFTNWNGGDLPPLDTNGLTAFNYALGTTPGQVKWGFGTAVNTLGSTDPTFEAIEDTVINSRKHPTMVAFPMSAGNDNGVGGGIRVLNATNGSVISVTNGATVQVLTNLDWGQAYTCAAWDNVGNLYAASTSRHLWRVWTPPGGSTNTTFSSPLTLSTNTSSGGGGTNTGSSSIKITGVTRSGQTLTIAFTDSENDAASTYTLQSATTLKGTYGAAAGATVTGSAGTYSVSATAPATGTEFYRIHHQ
ncbi:MAG TPA: FlgD immunoglobulin-like domain containing protein [Verrucomicrobiae bacterium]|jgi:hypothetical protein